MDMLGMESVPAVSDDSDSEEVRKQKGTKAVH